ncbi:MAG: DNA repair exonuclease [Acidobacteria bacterium]|nr:DNA repair exonuclease [Acidobacteriota bacterium]
MLTGIRFLQISDVHVDSELTHSRLTWPNDKREQRIEEINGLVERAVRLAGEREVEAVLIPGDLWDDEEVSQKSIHRLVEAFASIEPVPVFIAPGNHDFCSPTSMYSRSAQVARGMRPWSGNVFIFDRAEFQSIRHPSRPDVVVAGRAFLENVTTTERLLGVQIERLEAAISLLLFHGSLDGYTREGAGKVTAPFSREELLKQGFSYAALGHYHHFQTVLDPEGRIRAAYAGSPAGRTLTEDGPRTIVFGTAGPQGIEGELERVELDHRRLHTVEFDVTGSDSGLIQSQIDRMAAEQDWRTSDVIAVTLHGRMPKGASAETLETSRGGRYFHFKVIDRTRPDYDLDHFDDRTVEGRFIQEMKREMAAATDESARQLWERTLYYGLDALIQREVHPAYED